AAFLRDHRQPSAALLHVEGLAAGGQSVRGGILRAASAGRALAARPRVGANRGQGLGLRGGRNPWSDVDRPGTRGAGSRGGSDIGEEEVDVREGGGWAAFVGSEAG